jgi:hypothetical protein
MTYIFFITGNGQSWNPKVFFSVRTSTRLSPWLDVDHRSSVFDLIVKCMPRGLSGAEVRIPPSTLSKNRIIY